MVRWNRMGRDKRKDKFKHLDWLPFVAVRNCWLIHRKRNPDRNRKRAGLGSTFEGYLGIRMGCLPEPDCWWGQTIGLHCLTTVVLGSVQGLPLSAPSTQKKCSTSPGRIRAA